MNKITIVNGWHDLNTGDSAIIIGMIMQFEKKVNHFEINIISELCEENEFFKDSIEYVKQSFPKIKINLVGSTFYKSYKSRNVREYTSLIKNLFTILLPNIIFRKVTNRDTYFKTIIDSDIIMSKGGHFIYDRSGFKGLIHLFKCLFPLNVARKLNKPYYIISQSIGPFYSNSNNIFEKISYKMVKNVIANSKKISLREKVSFDNLKKDNLLESGNITGDYAFLINNIGNSKLKKELRDIVKNDKFVVITLRQHEFTNEEGENQYLKTIENIAKYIATNYNYKIVFISHVKGPNHFEDDRVIVKKFKMLFNNSNYIFITNQYSPQELYQFYSNAQLMIGTRFHSVIFALSNGVPSIAISYSGYKANIMNQFSLEKFMIDIKEIKLDNQKKLIEMVDELLINREKYSHQILNNKKAILSNINNDIAFNDAIDLLKKNR